MDKVKIGQRLAELRKQNGKSAVEVAAAVNISRSALCQYETGVRVPRDDIKIRLAKHYGVPVETIFFAD